MLNDYSVLYDNFFCFTAKTSRLVLSDKSWLRKALLSTSSRSMRQSACNIIEMVCQNPLRKRQVLDMLCKSVFIITIIFCFA